MKRLLAASLLAASLPATAGDLGNIGALSQEQFRLLSQDLGAALSYKGVTPATSLGPWGFDLGLELSSTDVKNSDIFRLAGAGSTDTLFVPKLHIYKGLGAGIDLGGFVAIAPDVDATLWGVDVRYAFVQDTLTTPALAVRLSGTRTTDLGSLKVSTYGADLMLSKRFTVATPYIGAGIVRVDSSISAPGLADETFNEGRYFGGVNLNLLLINLAVEAERLGDNTTLSAKLGWRF
ncbi:MAG: hypothetical protein NDI88_16145 [Lysobacter sp.]|nr:hypothetical protein [Lysobacter sp.]